MKTNLRAFPSSALDPAYGGMMLRDYFAAQAVAGLVSWSREPESVARAAYHLADAMLEARIK